MNDCYLNFLVSFRALFSLDVGANLVNSKQTIGIILPDLSLLGYAVPVESFGIGLFVILFAYLIIEYNVQLLSHEKFKIAMNMLHTAHTPLILLRNQLEELKTGNLPEPLSQQVEEALGYAECIYEQQNDESESNRRERLSDNQKPSFPQSKYRNTGESVGRSMAALDRFTRRKNCYLSFIIHLLIS